MPRIIHVSIPLIPILATACGGSEDARFTEVKEAIKKAGYGGGYICMSSNSIHSGVKPENYAAMIKAIREFGKYPLELD